MPQSTFRRDRYRDPLINRQYHLADALCFMKSYELGRIDAAATALTDAQVEAFCEVVATLNRTWRDSKPGEVDVYGVAPPPADEDGVS
jgi:hypothetical protein